jgi:ABC-type nitrate/sulfonate/bicarbonate transport system substrate-binding protein
MKVSSFHPQGNAGLSHPQGKAGLSHPHGEAGLSHPPGTAESPHPPGGAGPPGVRRRTVLAGGLALGLGAVAGCSSSSTSTSSSGTSTPTLKVLAFQAPSLGAFITSVITAKRFDTAHGLHLAFSYVTPDNYTVEFSSGQFQVGGSSALLSEALRYERGVPVTYLFNAFDFFGAVVTSNPAIRSLTDLHSHTLAAALGTTNYAMFQWFALKAGLNLKQVTQVNETTPGLSTMALTGRTDATEIWEPAYSLVLNKRPGIRTLDMGLARWQQTFGTSEIPYAGVAAHSGWVKANPDGPRKLYAIWSAAAKWTMANPATAAKIVAGSAGGDSAVYEQLIKANNLLKLHVAPSASMTQAINAVIQSARQSGYLSASPPSSFIYRGL